MGQSLEENRFWEPLWDVYPAGPSVVLCRIPELTFASTLDVSGTVLDHCCGDGRFAALAWPGQSLTAGCDINEHAIGVADGLNKYARLDVCDVSKQLPYEDETFDLIFNNSALEHILDLDSALAEVSRVLSPGGKLAFNVLNHRYFEWWPLDTDSKRDYREWQPFHHALSLTGWDNRLEAVGLRINSVQGYFDRPTAAELARLDCAFSGYFMANRPSMLVRLSLRLPQVMTGYWRRRLASLAWATEPDCGAGFFIVAERANG